ncbi:MAG TPA: phosphotransferase [Ktedonobacteraceae bacterium]|nr:phosphotransferase [Ktedonobacteraceae bacterium]
MRAHDGVITSWLARWETHFVEPVVFGTTEAEEITGLIDAFCQQALGAAVAEYLFYESSIGAVCGVRLVDGRRVVVKVHQASRSPDFLRAVTRVQHYLCERGYPCPRPLLAPQPLARGTATVEELIDEGSYRQASDPSIRRAMAEMLAWLLRLTTEPALLTVTQQTALDARLPEGVIWPAPHSRLFDFEATARGAEWIDEIARRAQESKLHGAGRMVVGHMDWGAKHFRFVGDSVRVIYDWDSLTFEKEPIIVGHASRYFTYTEFFGEHRLPTEDEARAFLAEYEAARGRPFTPEEHQTLQAAQLYSLAYSARCEHALHPAETTYPAGSCRASLARYRSTASSSPTFLSSQSGKEG